MSPIRTKSIKPLTQTAPDSSPAKMSHTSHRMSHTIQTSSIRCIHPLNRGEIWTGTAKSSPFEINYPDGFCTMVEREWENKNGFQRTPWDGVGGNPEIRRACSLGTKGSASHHRTVTATTDNAVLQAREQLRSHDSIIIQAAVETRICGGGGSNAAISVETDLNKPLWFAIYGFRAT